jgi:DNA-binding transcriptional MerR regulator
LSRAPEKSEGAFRTIREVADWLGVPTHVLRFWESKFAQIAPVKGAGGRRYYRPDDMRLLGGIKVLLHDRGLTIRAVTQMIDDQGVEPVMALSPRLEDAVDGLPPRTRRVIRQGEAGDRVVPLDASRRDRAGPVAIAKDPPAPLSETLPDQPDAPVAEHADSAPAPPEPEPLDDSVEPGSDATMPDEPASDAPTAPADRTEPSAAGAPAPSPLTRAGRSIGTTSAEGGASSPSRITRRVRLTGPVGISSGGESAMTGSTPSSSIFCVTDRIVSP